ncbi:hypothetical protein MEX01_41760 [Methylorubrum extorquens]|nr:hypothetical protein MEX01_41760 [Methylorubrum extorquens]
MKRRSARPFTVEVKHARTSYASLADATARSRKGPDLWRGLPLSAGGKPAEVRPTPVEPKPVAPAAPVQAKVQARRVLPSLVPTFAMPVEPEGTEERAALVDERLPRVRRLKQLTKRRQAPAAQVSLMHTAAAELAPQPRIVPVVTSPALADVPPVTAQPAPAKGRAARRNQQPKTLRLGERWKRRLPRILW